MGFEVGDHVHVASLGKGVVREVRNGGRYRVEIKGRSMVVGEAQLSPIDPVKKSAVTPAAPLPSRAHAGASIDLHGKTTEEAVAALDGFLDDAILAGLEEVRVIHGRSGGRVKSVVHARLKTIAAVRAFRVDPRNEGVTIVTL